MSDRRRQVSADLQNFACFTLAKVGTLAPGEARTLGSVAHGAHPAAQGAADKRASTLAEVAGQFLTEHVEAKALGLLGKFASRPVEAVGV